MMFLLIKKNNILSKGKHLIFFKYSEIYLFLYSNIFIDHSLHSNVNNFQINHMLWSYSNLIQNDIEESYKYEDNILLFNILYFKIILKRTI